MKSNEFILEGVTNDHQQFLNLVKHNCQPYLQQNRHPLTDSPLWRGMYPGNYSDAEGSYQKRNVRLTDRKPRDTPMEVHKILNQVFIDKYNAPYRNALFTTGRKMDIHDYGNGYIIFPIGKFEFIWSPFISDLWRYVSDKFKLGPQPIPPRDEQIKDVYEYINKIQYKQNDLEQAINSGNEIMMRCSSYYAIEFNTFRYEDRASSEAFLYEK